MGGLPHRLNTCILRPRILKQGRRPHRFIMSHRTLLRSAIQSLRVILLPFPVAVFLAMAALEIADHLLRPDRSNITSGDPGETIGGYLLIGLTVFLQLAAGMPSLLMLDSKGSGLRGYLTVATAIALSLSLLFAEMLHAPQVGETLGWMFFRVLLFLGVPLVLSYLLALYLRRVRDRISFCLP